MVQISKNLTIPSREFSFTFSRSSKPGGQNVNKVNTRVTLWFDVINSTSLSPEQKSRLLRELATRINKNGILRVVSLRHRSQAANRQAALERFVELLKEALKKVRPRKNTKKTKASEERRLAAKKHRSKLKKERTRIRGLND